VASKDRLRSAGRGRGRPVGADSAETRARILRAAREVINERGYHAATFQSIAERAGLSRATMHYYFNTREQVYDSLVHEASSVLEDCIAEARREDTLLKQLSAFVAAAHELGFADRSMMRFIVTSRLEYHRGAAERNGGGSIVAAVHAFYAAMVSDAIARGEIPYDTDAAAVVNMLLAMSWGTGFYAGFVNEVDMLGIAKQLRTLFAHGLLDAHGNNGSLILDPPAPPTAPQTASPAPG
jgi:AcrR family transcriptional regulator